MADQYGLITSQLVALLGEPNVTVADDTIVVRPSSGEEIAAVFALSAQAGMSARSVGYAVGPAGEDSGPADILISLEKMNQIIFDRQTTTITVQPAAEMAKIVDAARESGCIFKGATCRHKKGTVGENVAACFSSGEPDFQCATPCLCGLELVLTDGSIITVGEKLVKDLNAYQLTYLMGGNREEQAVLSGIHLRPLPAEQEEFWLVTSLQAPDGLPGLWRLLNREYRGAMEAALDLKLERYPELGEIVPWPQLPPACSLVSLRCRPAELEQLLPLLNDDTFVASGAYQKQLIAAFCGNLAAKLKADPQLTCVEVDEEERDINSAGLEAAYWRKEEGKFSLFYAV
ncbi:MAG: FAD-binding protein [Firmicutes bacterium]|nr:FAD-binding protein [Bacillota bacterium]